MALDGPFSSAIPAIRDDFSPVHPSSPSLLPSTRIAFDPAKASLDLMHPMVHLKMQLQNSVQQHVSISWKQLPPLLHSSAASRQGLHCLHQCFFTSGAILHVRATLPLCQPSSVLPAKQSSFLTTGMCLL